MTPVSDNDTDEIDETEFVDFHIKNETSPGAAWMELKDKLVDGAQSVEVIRNESGKGFVLRTWWSTRPDRSNSMNEEEDTTEYS